MNKLKKIALFTLFAFTGINAPAQASMGKMFRITGYFLTTCIGASAVMDGYKNMVLHRRYNKIKGDDRGEALLHGLRGYPSHFMAGLFTTVVSVNRLVNELFPRKNKTNDNDENKF